MKEEKGILKIVCAWCKKDMGIKPCPEELDGKTSHGICHECAERIRKTLEF